VMASTCMQISLKIATPLILAQGAGDPGGRSWRTWWAWTSIWGRRSCSPSNPGVARFTWTPSIAPAVNLSRRIDFAVNYAYRSGMITAHVNEQGIVLTFRHRDNLSQEQWEALLDELKSQHLLARFAPANGASLLTCLETKGHE
jgi:hypothetical protein